MLKQLVISFINLGEIITWVALFGLCFAMVAFMNLILDVREDNRLDRALRREERKKNT